MKIKGWQLIIFAVAIFLLDFLTLGNRNLIDNPLTNKIAGIVALICVLILFIGVIVSMNNFIKKDRTQENIAKKQEEEQGIRPTGFELGLRKFLAILLIISIIPVLVLLPFLGILLSLPNILLASYLFLNRRYHIIFDGILVILGLIGYYFNNLSLYKKIEFSLCPGLININEVLITNVTQGLVTYLFISVSLFLFMGDIISRQKWLRKRMLNFVSLIVILAVLLLLPFLYTPRVALGESIGGGTGGGTGPIQHFSAWNTQFHMSQDKALNTYTFTAEMPNQESERSSSITNICIDGKLIPLTTDNNMLQVENGEISDGKITVGPGQTATIKLTSQKPFYVVSLFEGEFHYQNSFLR